MATQPLKLINQINYCKNGKLIYRGETAKLPIFNRCDIINKHRGEGMEVTHMKYIYFELSQLCTQLSYAAAQIRPAKNSGLNGIRTHDLCDTGAVLHQLSYQANWDLVIIRNSFYYIKLSGIRSGSKSIKTLSRQWRYHFYPHMCDIIFDQSTRSIFARCQARVAFRRGFRRLADVRSFGSF